MDHRVYAGTINQSGALEIRVDRIGRDTTFGKIIDAVERAEKSRAPIQAIADRLAGYLVYFALGAAALTFLITAQCALDHFCGYRRGSVWHCSRNTLGDPWARLDAPRSTVRSSKAASTWKHSLISIRFSWTRRER